MSAPEPVIVHIDGASHGNPGPAGIGVVFTGADGRLILELSKSLGETTNNVAEYLALLYALQEAQARGLARLHVRTDSDLLAKQLHGEYRVRDATLRLFHDFIRHVLRAFAQCTISHVPREQNTAADRLATAAVEGRFAASVTTREVTAPKESRMVALDPSPRQRGDFGGGKSELHRAAYPANRGAPAHSSA